jgi:hypothetical protein
MKPPTRRTRGSGPSAGRSEGTTGTAEWIRRLRSAGPAAIDEALSSRDLNDVAVVAILRNRRTAAEQLERIGADPRWGSRREVRKRLFLHANTPTRLSRRLAPLLLWNDLSDALGHASLPPAARRLAERALEQRIEGMALGERISLARRATGGLIRKLAELREDRVLRGLLENRRIVESEVVRLAEDPETPPEFLAHLAGHRDWGTRRPVRLGLVANSRTPVPAALSVVESLASNDLHPLAKDDNVPTIVRVGAARVLSRRVPTDRAETPVSTSGDSTSDDG